MSKTAFILTSRVKPFNPFVSYVLPYALSDDLITHCVIALGASQFSSTHCGVPRPSATSHYSVALRCVRQRLKGLETDNALSAEKLVVLLLAILLLCQFEFVDGSQNGAILLHLCAARELLLRLGRLQVDPNIDGFLLELYSFMSIVSKTSIAGLMREPIEEKTVNKPDDSYVVSSRLDLVNRGTDSFGLLFGCSHALFEMIPMIEMLQCTSLSDNLTNSPPRNRECTFRCLENRTMNWEPPEDLLAQSSIDNETASDYRMMGRVYQQTVLIYFYTSYYGPESEHFEAARHGIGGAIDRIMAPLPDSHRIWSSLVWPAMVLGSYLRQQEHREMLARKLSSPSHNVFGCQRALEVLSTAWKRGYYGPAGLRRVMEERNIVM